MSNSTWQVYKIRTFEQNNELSYIMDSSRDLFLVTAPLLIILIQNVLRVGVRRVIRSLVAIINEPYGEVRLGRVECFNVF